MCSEKWKSLTEEEKACYRTQAEKSLATFRNEHPDYKYKRGSAHMRKLQKVDKTRQKISELEPLQFLN
jgi:hypothetical protein